MKKLITLSCLWCIATVAASAGMVPQVANVLNRQITSLCGEWHYIIDVQDIEHTLENALGMAAGIVCDGAKPSCAGKIALSVEAGILGYAMSLQGDNLLGGDGIIGKDVEETIDHIGCLGRLGMKETDVEILKIMVE